MEQISRNTKMSKDRCRRCKIFLISTNSNVVHTSYAEMLCKYVNNKSKNGLPYEIFFLWQKFFYFALIFFFYHLHLHGIDCFMFTK